MKMMGGLEVARGHLGREIPSAQAGHADIQNQAARVFVRALIQKLPGRRERFGVPARRLDQPCQRFAHARIVIRDQDGGRCPARMFGPDASGG